MLHILMAIEASAFTGALTFYLSVSGRFCSLSLSKSVWESAKGCLQPVRGRKSVSNVPSRMRLSGDSARG